MRNKEIKRIRGGISDSDLSSYVPKDASLIVECGCQDGQDTLRFVNLFPQAYIVCFEPDPRPIERKKPPGFAARIGDNSRVRFVPKAVSDKSGAAILYRSSGTPPKRNSSMPSEWDASNSLCKPTNHLTSHPWCRFTKDGRINVETTTLDEWFYLLASAPCNLLWVDVQGGQRALIAGGTQFLARTRWLYIECHHIPMYKGEPTQDELLELLAKINFRPIALYEGYNFLLHNESYGS